jgi:hypothetical protein
MGFKISPFDAFDRAERIHDKVNRRIPTSKYREPTLAEQIAELENKNLERKEQARLEREKQNAPRFHPMYEAKLKSDQAERERQQKLETKPNKK